MQRKFWFIMTAALMLALVSMIGCGSSEDADHTSSELDDADAPPGTVPQFAAYDIDGEMRQSSEWIGKQPVVVNIWGTWCPPCRHEIPAMVDVYNEYKDQGIEIIGLAVNDTPEKVKAFAQQQNMDWVLLMGDKSIVQQFGQITSVPTTIFLNADGEEIGRFKGARDYETFKAAFEELASQS